MSRDAGVVATCGTAGMDGGIATRLSNRMLGGHRWTVWSNSDAGMSQQVSMTDWRTVVDGVCYALFGSVPGTRRADLGALRSHHAPPDLPTEVVLDVTVEGRRLEVTRRPEQQRPKKSLE